MAGIYPDVPAPRLAYDTDGSKALIIIPGTNEITELSKSQRQIINNESVDSIAGGARYFVVIFPTITKLYGYFISAAGDDGVDNLNISFSSNTTNGVDGTWTTPVNVTNYYPVSPFYRNNITNLATPTDAIAVKVYLNSTYFNITYTSYMAALHLYGIPNTAQKLDFWHPTLDQAITGSYFDFGDIAQGTSTIKEFRLKNFSLENASQVRVSLEALTDVSPSTLLQHSLSLDGTTWFSYIDLPETLGIAIKSVNDAPNNISPKIYFRRNTSSSAALGLYTARIVVNTGVWS